MIHDTTKWTHFNTIWSASPKSLAMVSWTRPLKMTWSYCPLLIPLPLGLVLLGPLGFLRVRVTSHCPATQKEGAQRPGLGLKFYHLESSEYSLILGSLLPYTWSRGNESSSLGEENIYPLTLKTSGSHHCGSYRIHLSPLQFLLHTYWSIFMLRSGRERQRSWSPLKVRIAVVGSMVITSLKHSHGSHH